MKSLGRDRGVALITALLVVALVTVAAVAMVSRQQLDIRRTGNLVQADQAYHYALGLEQWGAQILRQDASKSTIDALDEDWATPMPPIPVDGGQIGGYLEDLQGRFNLNNLVDANGQRSAKDVERFQALLMTLQLSPDLADAVVDWLDGDIDRTSLSGAEDAEYLALDPPYRAANRPMADPSELRLVAGFDAETYQKLAPYIAALPAPTELNLNTAPAQVLTVIAPGMTVAEGEALVEARKQQAFQTVNDCLAQPVLAGKQTSPDGLSVKTGYFLARGTVNIGQIQMDFFGLLARTANGVRVIQRGQGAYGQ